MWDLYCDGGSKPNPGQAAYCAVLYEDGKIVESVGGYIGKSTNNKAEYKALYGGLKLLKENCHKEDEIGIHLDSQLVMNQVTGEWKVKDETLKEINGKCKKLYELYENIEMKWVKGHSGVEGNEYADSVCTYFIDRQKPEIKKKVSQPTMDTKIHLNCPFSEKETVKSMGARWDPKEKKWYITNAQDIDLFEKWI